MQVGWRGTVTLVINDRKKRISYIAQLKIISLVASFLAIAEWYHVHVIYNNFFRTVQEDSYSPPFPCCCYLVSGRSF